MKNRRSAIAATATLLLLLIIKIPAFSSSWYRGDLHTHSNHSDGDSPVALVIRNAEEKGLDFFSITDHDTSMRGRPTHWHDPDYKSLKMVLLYGVEWTSARGHANIWSAEPFEYESLWYANRNHDPETAATEAHRQGALFSINHPLSFAGSVLEWSYDFFDEADSIEIWNSMFNLPVYNLITIRNIWDRLLSQGLRIPGVGGSDAHHLFEFYSCFYGIGNPTTWVYAENLAPESILEAIKAGNVSISYSPYAPRLDFSADRNGDGTFQTIIGQSMKRTNTPVSFKIEIFGKDNLKTKSRKTASEIKGFNENQMNRWVDIINILSTAGLKPYIALVLKNGKIFRTWILTAGENSIIFQDTPSQQGYYRVELYGLPEVYPYQYPFYGNMIALTNPIYID